MARRVDVVREYLLKEHDLDLPEEIIIERVDPPLQEGDILKKIDGKWYLIKGGIAYEYEEVAE